MANEHKMGFEGLIYYGTPGTTAATLIPDTADMALDFGASFGDTTARNPDGLPPMETGQVTGRTYGFTFSMLNVPGNAVLAAILAAAYAGVPIAFRSKDFATGKGYDGEMNVTFKLSKPLRGEQKYDFTLKPNRQYGRYPQYYV